jgi:hypothetical protein
LLLLNVTTGIGDFGTAVRVAVAGTFDPAVNPYDAIENPDSSVYASATTTPNAESRAERPI